MIVTGPEDMTLEYRDVLTATFTCTAFGGDAAQLEIRWGTSESDVTGFNSSSRTFANNSNGSYTSSITTLSLSLTDRGDMFTCRASYESASISNAAEARATLSIGEMTTILCRYINP